jgi:hypothetical protein
MPEDEKDNREDRENFYRDYIDQLFSDVLRSLMRALGADDPYNSIYQASNHMERLLKEAERFKVPLDYYGLFRRSIEEIRKNLADSGKFDRGAVNVAEKGLMYLVEASCGDSAAAGRASQRRDKFESWAKSWVRGDR